MPQVFTTEIKIEKNKPILNITIKELYSKNFCEGDKVKSTNLDKYKKNLFVLKYLEENKEISEKSNFNFIKNMTYSKAFKEYIHSKEFENDILNLKFNKFHKFDNKYLTRYIENAFHFLEFYSK